MKLFLLLACAGVFLCSFALLAIPMPTVVLGVANGVVGIAGIIVSCVCAVGVVVA